MDKEPNPIRITQGTKTWVASRASAEDSDEEYFCKDGTWRKAEGEQIPTHRFDSWKDALETLHAADQTDTLLEEYLNRSEHPPTGELDLPKKILFDIMADLTDRRGIRQAWGDIDNQNKEQILRENLENICGHLLEDE